MLELADMWHMETLKETILETLHLRQKEISPEHKVAWGMRFGQQEWVSEGSFDLVEQGEPLSVEQMSVVGFPVTFMLSNLREQITGMCGQSWTDVANRRVRKNNYESGVRGLVNNLMVLGRV